MAKCDVCNKNTLLPEKFGEVRICKICFIRINGPLWKRQYDRHDDAEKHRCKALEVAHKHNYPQHTISSINDFFMAQMSSMLPCDCCHHPVQHRQLLGKANICTNCFEKINTRAWRETEYEDNSEVEENRKKVLKIAHKNNFPSIVIDGINQHFDSRIQKGLLYVINGGKGQKLKVFVDHCILITNSRDFNSEQISAEYVKAQKRNQPHSSYVGDLAKSVFTGNVIGITVATSRTIGAAAEQGRQINSNPKVIPGEYKINYHVYSYADYQKAGDTELGFIRFINCKTGGRPNDDLIFFFSRDNSKIDKAYKAICDGIDISFQPVMQPIPITTAIPHQTQLPPNPTPATVSVADEILKFKQLLDMGAITQEEFNAKKKELLNQ